VVAVGAICGNRLHDVPCGRKVADDVDSGARVASVVGGVDLGVIFIWADSGSHRVVDRLHKEFRKMACMTSAERIARFRQRKAEAGQAEVRGIYAPPELHAAIKRAAELLKGEEPKEPD
jgi:hypothetical protein